VANKLAIIRSGAVGFIDWLGACCHCVSVECSSQMPVASRMGAMKRAGFHVRPFNGPLEFPAPSSETRRQSSKQLSEKQQSLPLQTTFQLGSYYYHTCGINCCLPVIAELFPVPRLFALPCEVQERMRWSGSALARQIQSNGDQGFPH